MKVNWFMDFSQHDLVNANSRQRLLPDAKPRDVGAGWRVVSRRDGRFDFVRMVEGMEKCRVGLKKRPDPVYVNLLFELTDGNPGVIVPMADLCHRLKLTEYDLRHFLHKLQLLMLDWYAVFLDGLGVMFIDLR